jgi:Flp pilus assembly protein TadB
VGAALADLLELAARDVRTGVAPDRALVDAAAVVGPPAGALVAERVRWVGAGDARDASRRWALRHHDPAVSIVAATVGLVSGRGGGAARGFEAAANVLRERDRRARDAEAWAAQARASATLLVGAPVVLAIGSFAIDPRRAGRVLAEPIALACVAAGAGCELIGAWWMGRLLADASGARS